MSANATSPAAPPPQPAASIKEGLLGLLNVYIDPASTARRVQLKWFWIYPLVVLSIISTIVQLQLIPFTIQAMTVDPPNGASGEQLAKMLSMTATISHIAAYCTPLIILIFTCIAALLVMAVGAIVDARVKFQHLISLLLTCGMISTLQYIAAVIVLRSKGLDDIQSMHQLQVPLGLDIFINATGALGGLLNYFSIFMIWYIVMLGLTYSHMAKVSKGKAFFATSPAWLIGLLFAVLGAMFRK
jgi:molybdopterin/thiamine biosynthesis adenylyltransferase